MHGDAVVGQHEVLQCFVTQLVVADGRDDEGCRVRGRVLFAVDDDARRIRPRRRRLRCSGLGIVVAAEAESYCIEKRYVRKDGGIVWGSLAVGCVKKTDGGVDYFISVVQGTTDRKRAEARLAERNAQLDLAGKIARIGSFMYEGRLTVCRPKRTRCQPRPATLGFVRRSGDAVSKLDWAGDGAELFEAFAGAKDGHIAIVEHAPED